MTRQTSFTRHNVNSELFVKRTKKKSEISARTPHQANARAHTHIRRCHKCDSVNECDEQDVKACAACGKPVAPFYFFSDTDVVPHSDNGLRPERPDGKVKPVLGFTAYW